MYPDLAKRWVNRCLICGATGYKPELPDVLKRRMRKASDAVPTATAAARNLRELLPPLPVDALGRCEACAEMADDDSDSEEGTH